MGGTKFFSQNWLFTFIKLTLGLLVSVHGKSLQLPYHCPEWRKILTQYGLSSHKRPLPISDGLGLTYWVVAYRRFDYIRKHPAIGSSMCQCAKQSALKNLLLLPIAWECKLICLCMYIFLIQDYPKWYDFIRFVCLYGPYSKMAAFTCILLFCSYLIKLASLTSFLRQKL